LGQHFSASFVQSIIVYLEEFFDLALMLDEALVYVHSLGQILVLQFCQGVLNLTCYLRNGLIVVILVGVYTDSADEFVRNVVVKLYGR